MAKGKNNGVLYAGLRFLFFLTVACSILPAQEVQKKTLTRGKLWICALPNGSEENEDGYGSRWYDAYPGYYDQNNDITGGESSRIFNVAQVEGEEVGWYYRTARTQGDVYSIDPTTLVKNYNLVNSAEPEEYFYGTMGSFKLNSEGKRHMAYRLEGKVMAWSQSKYDDFVLIKCKLTNTDDVLFKNFYYARYVNVLGPGNPLGTSFDMEYLWDGEVSDDIGFIYYDDTSWSPTSGDSAKYPYSPGNVTGDRGDPGNIKIANSTDKKLYSPHLYAMSFLKQGLTSNKQGQKKVWRCILSGSGSAPFEDKYPGDDQMTSWSTMTDILSREQPAIGWRQAHATYKAGNLAGSLWERNPRYVYAIGPYDIAPGESIEWTELFLAGQMDRNITILGGLNATSKFVQEGLKNLKENWAAAKELVLNNFKVPKDIPPPTPADVPRVNNTAELLVEAAVGMINGQEASGVNLVFKGVHVGYKDPLIQEADFAEYRIYRSDISVEGPWKQISTLSAAEADKRIQNGKVTFFLEAPVGVPYRYCVTSADKYGNESGMTGYSLVPVSASIFPSNKLTNIKVVPNPFRQESGFLTSGERKRIAFVNVPSKCTIRIYTVALDLVKTIEHEGSGEVTWGKSDSQDHIGDYMLTDFAMNVMPGVYIYHVESRVAGHEGESTMGKLVILK